MALVDLNKLTPASFPTAEDDEFEFKSSKTTDKQIIEKLNCAGSAFANAGGGCFIWGVDKATGDPDGGVDPTIGRQNLRDWLDQVMHRVVPTPMYDVQLYDNNEGRGTLDAGKVVAAVSIHPSAASPHMAADKKYYIRAGAHTLEAGHFIVEALWAKRQVQAPYLKLILDLKGLGSTYYVSLGIVNMTSSPALNVVVDFMPKSIRLSGIEALPLRVPLVDRERPYFMNLRNIENLRETLTADVQILVEYEDMAGNKFSTTAGAELIKSIPPSLQMRVQP